MYQKFKGEIETEMNSGSRAFPLNIAAVVPNMFDARVALHKTYLKQVMNDPNPLVKDAIAPSIHQSSEFQYQLVPMAQKGSRKLKGNPKKQMDDVIEFIRGRIWEKV